MAEQISEKALVGMINSAISSLKSKTKINKRRFQIFSGLSIILGAAITLTLGLDLSELSRPQKNIGLLLGVILTIVNSWLALFDYKKLWMRQKVTLLSLYQLRNHIIYLSSTKRGWDQKELDEIFTRYQNIWDKDSNEWLNIYSIDTAINNELK